MKEVLKHDLSSCHLAICLPLITVLEYDKRWTGIVPGSSSACLSLCLCVFKRGKKKKKNPFNTIRMRVIVLIQLAFDLWCQSQSGRGTTGGLQIKPKGRGLISPLVSRLCLMGMNREIPAHTHACFLLHRCSGAGKHIIRHFRFDDEGQPQMKG